MLHQQRSTGPYYWSVPFSTAEYIVGSFDNGTYFMQNGSDWSIDEYGTEARQIINDTIANMTVGGEVYIKAGTYNITCVPQITAGGNVASIVVAAPIRVYCEKGTVFNMSGAWLSQYSCFSVKSNKATIEGVTINGNTNSNATFGFIINNVNDTIIKDVTIYNDSYLDISVTGASQRTQILNFHSYNNGGITANSPIGIGINTSDTYIDRLWVENTTGPTGQGVAANNGENIAITNSLIENTYTNYGITHYQNSSLKVLNCRIRGSGKGILLGAAGYVVPEYSEVAHCNFKVAGYAFEIYAKNSDIHDNYIESTGSHAIVLRGGASNNTIHDNIVQVSSASCKDIYILSDAGSKNTFHDNNFVGTGVISDSSGQTQYWHDNLNFVTENFGSTASCINGTWIAHGLASIPTSIRLAISGNSYINASSCLLQPTVIASNSTHFQIGFLMQNSPINRLKGITPSATLWDVGPTNLAYVTDGVWSTVTGTGYNNLTGPGYFGTLDFNMSATYTVELQGKIGGWSNTSSVSLYWYYSTDGTTWVNAGGTAEISGTSTTEVVHYAKEICVNAQYVRAAFYTAGGATSANVKIYEIRAMDSESAITAVTFANAQTINWEAVYVP